MKNFPLTIFDNTFATSGINTSVEEELLKIKNGTYKREVLSCREALLQKQDKDLYKKLKSNLKAVTFCGVFEKGRKLENLVLYNSLIVIDIDNLTHQQVRDCKQKLSYDKYLMALWESPSTFGLKGIVKIKSSPNEHKKLFTTLSIYFLQTYGIELDKSGSDVTRLCYVSWDESIYINLNSEVFENDTEVAFLDFIEIKPTKNKNSDISISLNKSAYATEGLNKSSDRLEMKKIIKYLTGKQLSITSNYADWIKVAVVIANTFSFDVGENYFLSLCRLDTIKHNEYKSVELIKFCYNKRNINQENRLTFATIVYLASLKGYIKR